MEKKKPKTTVNFSWKVPTLTLLSITVVPLPALLSHRALGRMNCCLYRNPVVNRPRVTQIQPQKTASVACAAAQGVAAATAARRGGQLCALMAGLDMMLLRLAFSIIAFWYSHSMTMRLAARLL
jgi:hypothetical protein